MTPQELIKRIRRIQIRTSHMASDVFAGHYHSAFKGQGIEFEEVREYEPGDDIRSIDWNVTARHGKPFIKRFREEREQTVMLLVDVSGSQAFGTAGQLKRDLVTEVGATIAFSAITNNDKVGLIIFTDDIELHVRPAKGTRHVLRVIRELLTFEPKRRGTNVSAALEHLNRVLRRRSVVFIISDFLDQGYEHALRVSRKRHDIIPICIRDPREREMPNVRFLELFDNETGETALVDTSAASFRAAYRRLAAGREAAVTELFQRLKAASIELTTGQSFVEPLARFFRERETRLARG